mmetsp:Transcript_27503/g.46305  ORF Transcript_27503/g.46305 Transcript_27503/m.46305 type:complete len:196 (+) Transcript_27503:684-1271(+)
MGTHMSRVHVHHLEPHVEPCVHSRARILVLGLDGGGKTTLLESLRRNQDRNKEDAEGHGIDVSKVLHKNVACMLCEPPGQKDLRVIWKSFFPKTDALIFVLDSTDQKRTETARAALHQCLQDENLEGVPSLTCANEQDLPSSLPRKSMITQLKLQSCFQKKKDLREYHVAPTVATTGAGSHQAMEQLRRMMSSED